MFRVIFFTIFCSYLFSWDFSDFDVYQNRFTFQEIERKIIKYLEKDPAIQKFYQLTPDALHIGDLEQQQIDYILHLRTQDLISSDSCSSFTNLMGAKIAIDPGHFGGIYAELEERYIAISQEKTKNGQAIWFCEGDLTYLTALALKCLLEQEGAEVMMTRAGFGKGAIEEDFSSWLQKHPGIEEQFSSLSKCFRSCYNKEDLQIRAEKINAFSPDITVVIHYNAHLTDSEKKAHSIFSQTNYNLAFIPGAFCAEELKEKRDRYEFLRLLVTDHIEESTELSRHILTQFVEQLEVPLIAQDEKTSYTDSVCLFQEEGIYCRNLLLTRLVHTPICYGETLVQNNEEEVYRLSSEDGRIMGVVCPKRIEQVAEAYFEGIKQYYRAKTF
jgi:N-acetylmuramoyl-L-alanine amidase